MIKFFLKILKTPRDTISIKDIVTLEQEEIQRIGKEIKTKVNQLFKGSLAIRQVDAGSDNACEQELVALSNSFYDVERFGIHLVASTKHADMLLISGPVTRNMKKSLLKAYETTPNPKIIVAIGNDAIDGGIYKGSYTVHDGVNNVLPVHYNIPGDPPSPKTILYHLLKIINDIGNIPIKS